MADPTGTAGATKQSESELDLIYRGGGSFMDRMKAMSDMRDASEAAYAKLKIGKDIQAARDNAASLQADALAKRAEAIKTLDDAKKQAAKLIDDAGKQANKTKDAALDDAKTIAVGAAKLKADADDYASKTKAQADALLKDAAAIQAQTKTANAAATLSKAKHEDAAVGYLAKQQIAEYAQAKLNAKIARLNEVLREVMGD